MENETDILENMKKCYKILQESLKRDILYFYLNFVDESGNFTLPLSKYYSDSVVFASHIGLVGVRLEDVQLRFIRLL